MNDVITAKTSKRTQRQQQTKFYGKQIKFIAQTDDDNDRVDG